MGIINSIIPLVSKIQSLLSSPLKLLILFEICQDEILSSSMSLGIIHAVLL